MEIPMIGKGFGGFVVDDDPRAVCMLCGSMPHDDPSQRFLRREHCVLHVCGSCINEGATKLANDAVRHSASINKTEKV